VDAFAGRVFSSLIISTDAPMLMFAALALYGYAGLLANPASRRDAAYLGLGLGLGLLSKLAMAYALAGLVLAFPDGPAGASSVARAEFLGRAAFGHGHLRAQYLLEPD